MDFNEFLKPTFFIDTKSSNVEKLALNISNNAKNEIEKVTKIFNFVRDSIKYTVENFQVDNPEGFKASITIKEKRGFCIPKAIVLVALLRACSFPARLHFADIINHRSPQYLQEIMGTNIYAFHGYSEVLLDNKWIKLTPSFDTALCERQNLPVCIFDGKHDAIFSSLDNDGKPFIEYINDRGTYADLPFQEMVNTMTEFYGKSLLDKTQINQK